MVAKTKPRERKLSNRGASRLPLTVSRPELLSNESDAAFRELLHHMLAFGSGLQEVRNRFGLFIGLSGTQYTILQAISRLSQRTETLGISQLAEHLHLSGAFVTIEVNKLVAADLVQKVSSQEDRRRVVLSITPAAARLLADLSAVQCPGNDTLFAGLSVDEFEQLNRLMAKLSGNVEPTLRLLDYLTTANAPATEQV